MPIATKKPEKHETERDVYSFALILGGIKEIDESIEKALFEAGCDDALLGITDGQFYLTFDREATSLKEAIVSAIHAVENCGKDIRVIEVVPPGEHFIKIVNFCLQLREEGKTLPDELIKALMTR
jgi:hypothetical protein